MIFNKKKHLMLHILRARSIARRYLITNGFDGVLAKLGLLMGFRVSAAISIEVMIGACLGAAVALFMSGLSSAYISEAAEQQQTLDELRGAMVSDMQDSAHSRAATVAPVLVALANGGAPLLMGRLIMLPLWLSHLCLDLGVGAIEAALAIAVVLIFLLGMFLGRVRGSSLLLSGLLTLVIAAVTMGLILLLGTA